MSIALEPISLGDIEAARGRIAGIAIRTPLIRLGLPETEPRSFLKLENLQPIGAFKLRGAANAMALADRGQLAGGVYTASAGNMAQGVAWAARAMGVPCRVIVPDTAPETKVAAIERLGAEVVKLPFDVWWQTMVDHGHPDFGGLFVHPFADPAVMAGNATIGLEILEDLPDVDAIVAPFGGGVCHVASARWSVRSRPTSRSMPPRSRPRRASPRRLLPGARCESSRHRASWMGSAARACSRTCGHWPARCSPARGSCLSRPSHLPCAPSPSDRASSPRERA